MSVEQAQELRFRNLMFARPSTRATHYQQEAARLRELALAAATDELRRGFFEVAVKYDELALTVSRRLSAE